jgi:hypothetical protein
MSFFLLGKLTCFICSQVIERRVDAARLSYAEPSAVGEDAKRGRPVVHRGCWNNWSKRVPWAASAADLLERGASKRTVRCGSAVCTLNDERSVLFQDPYWALQILVPVVQLEELAQAFAASDEKSAFVDGATWRFVNNGELRRISAEQGGEVFESLDVGDATAWSSCLRQAAEAQL